MNPIVAFLLWLVVILLLGWLALKFLPAPWGTVIAVALAVVAVLLLLRTTGLI